MIMKYLVLMSCVLMACSNPAPKDAKGEDQAPLAGSSEAEETQPTGAGRCGR